MSIVTQLQEVSHTCIEEIKALLGLLIFSGCRKDNHLHTQEMFNSLTGQPLYRAGMSERRFSFLIRCLRFDDRSTRDARRQLDRLAPIRSYWDSFIKNCTNSFNPGANLTVDEQLLAFRGRCSFRMYIPNKPAKYGLKIVMICDASTSYLLNAIPYLGKEPERAHQPTKVPLGHYFTKELARPYFNTNRNITTDNWFTSVELSEDLLLNHGLTTVGTLRMNKPHVPPEMKQKEGRTPGTVLFCFDKNLSLCSYMPKRKRSKKIVLTLSAMHSTPIIDTSWC